MKEYDLSHVKLKSRLHCNSPGSTDGGGDGPQPSGARGCTAHRQTPHQCKMAQQARRPGGEGTVLGAGAAAQPQTPALFTPGRGRPPTLRLSQRGTGAWARAKPAPTPLKGRHPETAGADPCCFLGLRVHTARQAPSPVRVAPDAPPSPVPAFHSSFVPRCPAPRAPP